MNRLKALHECTAHCGVELCGATAQAHGWGYGDILPGIKINTDAMARTTRLVQEGYVKISEY